MYTVEEIETIFSTCRNWSQLLAVCKAFDWLILKEFIKKEGRLKEIVRVCALKRFDQFENYSEDGHT